eukprot:13487861-Alexandrium_andersonii.AAC.1
MRHGPLLIRDARSSAEVRGSTTPATAPVPTPEPHAPYCKRPFCEREGLEGGRRAWFMRCGHPGRGGAEACRPGAPQRPERLTPTEARCGGAAMAPVTFGWKIRPAERAW